jgi:hypothetical protein
MKLFPSSPLTSLLKGYSIYMGIALSTVEENSEELKEGPEEDALDMILVSHLHRFLSNKVFTLSRMHIPPFLTP